MPELSPELDAHLRELQQRWMAAWVAQDRAMLERILAPEFALVISARPTDIIPRAVWLETAVGGYVCTALKYRDMTVRAFGEVAVVSAVGVQQASTFGVDRSGALFTDRRMAAE